MKKKIYISAISGKRVSKLFSAMNPDTTYSTHQPSGTQRTIKTMPSKKKSNKPVTPAATPAPTAPAAPDAAKPEEIPTDETPNAGEQPNGDGDEQPPESETTGDKLTEEEILEILRLENETFSGDRRAACAAHVYGEMVVIKCAGEPPFADKKRISNLKGQVTKYATANKK